MKILIEILSKIIRRAKKFLVDIAPKPESVDGIWDQFSVKFQRNEPQESHGGSIKFENLAYEVESGNHRAKSDSSSNQIREKHEESYGGNSYWNGGGWVNEESLQYSLRT